VESREHRLSSLSVHALALDPRNPGTLYAGTDTGQVFRTNDGAQTGRDLRAGITAPVRSLAIDPGHSGTLYAATTGADIYKTTDGGATWVALTTGLSRSWNVVAVDPVGGSFVYAGGDGALLARSDDGGAHWSKVTVPNLVNDDVKAIAIDPVTPSTLYVAGFKTKDGGATWTFMDFFRVRSLAVDPRNTENVYMWDHQLGPDEFHLEFTVSGGTY
jgi:photosystem II stability/assembly factor-like uncharacterized protein